MEKILIAILNNLDQLTITGKDAERMTATKNMVRDLLAAIRASNEQNPGPQKHKGTKALKESEGT